MKNLKTTKALVFVLLIIGSLTTTANAQCSSHQALIDTLVVVLNDEDTSRLSEVYLTNADFHQANGTWDGLTEIQAGFENVFSQMPNATYTIDETICTTDKFVLRWTLTGYLQGTTKQITQSSINVYHVSNGKITEEWASTDYMSVAKQLGYELREP